MNDLTHRCRSLAKRTLLLYSTMLFFLFSSILSLFFLFPSFYQLGWIAFGITAWLFLLFVIVCFHFQWDHFIKEELRKLSEIEPTFLRDRTHSIETLQKLAHLLEKKAKSVETQTPYLFELPHWIRFLQSLVDLYTAFFLRHYFLQLQTDLLITATDIYRTAIRKNPTNLLLHVRLSKIYLDLYRLSDASKASLEQRETFRACVLQESEITHHFLMEQEPPPLWYFLSLAENMEELDEKEKAITLYEEALSHYDETYLILRLGKLYFQNRWYAKGLALCHKLQERDPELAQELLEAYT